MNHHSEQEQDFHRTLEVIDRHIVRGNDPVFLSIMRILRDMPRTTDDSNRDAVLEDLMLAFDAMTVKLNGPFKDSDLPRRATFKNDVRCLLRDEKMPPLAIFAVYAARMIGIVREFPE